MGVSHLRCGLQGGEHLEAEGNCRLGRKTVGWNRSKTVLGGETGPRQLGGEDPGEDPVTGGVLLVPGGVVGNCPLAVVPVAVLDEALAIIRRGTWRRAPTNPDVRPASTDLHCDDSSWPGAGSAYCLHLTAPVQGGISFPT